MTVAEQFTLLSIGLLTILVRIYIRWRSVGPTNWQIDDYMMPLTGVSHCTTWITSLLTGPWTDCCHILDC